MANSLTYPVAPITDTEELTPDQIHAILKNEKVIARRVRTIAAQRFISDALLKGRFKAVGGSVLYENGDPLFIDSDPESIQPGGEYPQEQTYEGDLAVAKVDKWGKDVPITDEAIKRRGIYILNKSVNQSVNRMVEFVDRAALGVIASKVTATSPASGTWTTASAIVRSVETAKAVAEESGEGHSLDTIVLKPTHYATVMALFLDAGFLPREASNPLISGRWPTVLDLTWLRSPHVASTSPQLFNTDELGGMADEDLGGPGYAKALAGVEVKSIRKDDNDSYRLRSRRVTIPVVTDATAGVTITGTGLS